MIPVVVVDTSVVVKWVCPGRPGEADEGAALALLGALRALRVRGCQPVHWLAEVAAVLARLTPETAAEDVRALCDLDLPVLDDRDVYERAVALACELRHHLFDTLYHAVALSLPAGVLVTADEAYFAKARGRGAIARLSDFRAP